MAMAATVAIAAVYYYYQYHQQKETDNDDTARNSSDRNVSTKPSGSSTSEGQGISSGNLHDEESDEKGTNVAPEKYMTATGGPAKRGSIMSAFKFGLN